ncbi:hypothetical protein BH20ACT5_BH20ACT5_15060 [soil metagenome]
MFEDVHVWAELPDGPALRIRAASLVLPTGGAISGRSAAFVHGVDVLLDPDEPVEVTVPRTNTLTGRDGLVVRRALLPASDVERLRGIQVTAPLRTAFDLARLQTRVEVVIGLDAMLHARLITPTQLESYIHAHPRWCGVRLALVALTHADGDAESPMESRLRMVLVDGGLPKPLVNKPLFLNCVFLARPDLRIEHVIGEYDGQIHREADVFVNDLARHNRLDAAGYTVRRYTAGVIYHQPQLIVAQISAALYRRAA